MPDAPTPVELAARLAADREGAPYLRLRDERNSEILVRLGDRAELTIGRLPGNDLVIDWHPSVSRTHAVLERLGAQWTVVDDGLSSNGTFVGEERVHRRRRLQDGDVLRLGDLQLTFREPQAPTVPTAPVLKPSPTGVSPAQRRVLVALCRPVLAAVGPAAPASNREIADELNLSVESVRTHLRALFDAFDLPDLPQNRKRAELARAAVAGGTVSARDLER